MISYFRSNAVTVVAMLGGLLVWGCGGDDGGNGGGGPTDPPTTGSLRVTVNADGSPHSGVTVERYAPGSTSPASTATTGNDGRVTFSNLEPGTWEVEVVLPTGFELDAGEDERKSATVIAGETANTSFDLVDTFDGEEIQAQDNLTFDRPNVSISAGTAVRWTNVGIMLHTVTPDGHSEWSAASLGSNGSTFTHTFDTPGTYEYYCEPHLSNGMTGTITVN